ncbi:YceI family protein [Dyella sp. 333MFSha]|uniref:YceI family protein n=1 Tax=Dyella sp. 333MFSha TaxID=1798240 RepID=UPI0008912335|nr:YceI family protein [Dyella sp. 333MFSha]SDF89947.1 Polyisoprenoid-binding protein YceI [Dyella sp. 333MFSha]
MRNARFLPAVLFAIAPLYAHGATTAYRIDPVHSQVVFNVEHNGFSRSFGRLKVTEGTVRFDPDDWSKSSVDATIDLASVDMGDAEWNKAVRGASLLDSDRAKTAHYVSDSVEKKSDDEGTVHGKLTLRGKTLPLDLPFRVNRIGKTIYGLHTVAGFSSTVTLDRAAYGMTSNKNSIGNDVSVWLEIEAIRGGDAQTRSDKETPDAPAQ